MRFQNELFMDFGSAASYSRYSSMSSHVHDFVLFGLFLQQSIIIIKKATESVIEASPDDCFTLHLMMPRACRALNPCLPSLSKRARVENEPQKLFCRPQSIVCTQNQQRKNFSFS